DDCSPSTQRGASTRFDLPHPLGPTIPLIPLENSRLVASTNDLKPHSSRRLMRMAAVVTHARERVKAKTLQNVAIRLRHHYMLDHYRSTSSVFQYAASTVERNGSHSRWRRRLHVSSTNGVQFGRSGRRSSVMPASSGDRP